MRINKHLSVYVYYSVILIIAFFIVLVGLFSVAVNSTGAQNFNFPVRELGGCGSYNECWDYCTQDSVKYMQCIDYLRNEGFISLNRADDLLANVDDYPPPSASVSEDVLGEGTLDGSIEDTGGINVQVESEESSQIELHRPEIDEIGILLYEQVEQIVSDTERLEISAIEPGAGAAIREEARIIVDEFVTGLRERSESPRNASVDVQNRDVPDIISSLDRVDTLVDELLEELSEYTDKGPEVSVRNTHLKSDLVQKVSIIEGIIVPKEDVLNKRHGILIIRDTDGDLVTDYDEINIYYTDHTNPDTDGDGVSDGKELLAQADPRNPSPSAKIIFENPQEVSATLVSEELELKDVYVTKTRTTSSGIIDAEEVTLSGRGPKNSFVTLFVFSSPIVITVRTDDAGQWEYTLKEELSDGSHETFVAIVDNSGKILAKSRPTTFIKQAAAIEVTNFATLVSDSKPGFFNPLLLGAGVLLTTVLFIGTLIMIGHNNKKREEELSSTGGPSGV